MSASTLIRLAVSGAIIAGAIIVLKKQISNIHCKGKNPFDDSLLANRVIVDAVTLRKNPHALTIEIGLVEGLVEAFGNRTADCGKSWKEAVSKAQEVIAAGGQVVFSTFAPIWSDYDKRVIHQVKLYDNCGNTVADGVWRRNARPVKS